MTYNRERRAAYGQNYIKNPALVRYVVGLLDVRQGESVVDVGAGEGAFTRELATMGAQVVALELDADNVQELQKLPGVEVVPGDARQFEPKWTKTPLEHGEYVTVGNIPFNLSSELVKIFLLKKPMPRLAAFVVQREFAERIVGTHERSLVSTLIECFYTGEIIHRFHKGDFSPKPSVDTVFVMFTLRSDIPSVILRRLGEFKDVIKRGYTQPIKRIGKKLATEISGREWMTHFVDSVK